MPAAIDMGDRPRLLFLEPFYGDLGGGAIVSLWMLQALRREFDVTVLSWNPLDLERLNRFAGTDLTRNDFNTMRPLWPTRMLGEALIRIDPDPYSILRWALLMRSAKTVMQHYDLVVSCNNETDLGMPCIQYVHYPYLTAHVSTDPASTQQRSEALTKARFRPWRLISGFDFASMAANRTLANSDWTSALFSQCYGAAAETLYPPVPGEFAQRPWHERDDVAICVGRMSRDKRLDVIIDVVRHVRRSIPTFKLRIMGLDDAGPDARGVRPALEQLAAANDWIDLRVNVSRAELCEELSRAKIGIHAKLDEHFGIGVAELVRAGCITFVHDSGGQVEIVGRDSRLRYRETEEAAAKITAVLSDATLRADVLCGLEAQRRRFATEFFCERLLQITREFLTRRAFAA